MAIALSNILLTVLSYILLGEIIVGPRFSEILSVLTFSLQFFFKWARFAPADFHFALSLHVKMGPISYVNWSPTSSSNRAEEQFRVDRSKSASLSKKKNTSKHCIVRFLNFKMILCGVLKWINAFTMLNDIFKTCKQEKLIAWKCNLLSKSNLKYL